MNGRGIDGDGNENDEAWSRYWTRSPHSISGAASQLLHSTPTNAAIGPLWYLNLKNTFDAKIFSFLRKNKMLVGNTFWVEEKRCLRAKLLE